MKQTFLVRVLGPDDAAAFRSLRLAGLRESAPAFCSSYEEEVVRPVEATTQRLEPDAEQFVVGAFDAAGALLGVAGFYRNDRIKTRHRGTVWGMYVAPEARGLGAGRALLEAIVARAAAIPGLAAIDLSVTVGQVAARRLYERVGFRAWGLEPGALWVDGRSYDMEHMVLDMPSD